MVCNHPRTKELDQPVLLLYHATLPYSAIMPHPTLSYSMVPDPTLSYSDIMPDSVMLRYRTAIMPDPTPSYSAIMPDLVILCYRTL